MYVCMYVCMCVYICMYVCVCMCTFLRCVTPEMQVICNVVSIDMEIVNTSSPGSPGARSCW